MTFRVWRGWKAYAIKSWLVQSLINKKGLLDYNNSISISATFLMKVLIHIFVRERFTFATSHSEVWLSVLTYSLSNMWYIMCGDNMLKIDVKKTLENGEENGMIEESPITISHSASLLFFSNCNFFLLFSSSYFLKILNKPLSFDNTSAIWPNRDLSHSQGVLLLLYTWCLHLIWF